MTSCPHKNIELVAEPPGKVQCKHCHLTISREELGGSYCPECYEVDGKKRYDFEETASDDQGITRYRCEDCGAIIEA